MINTLDTGFLDVYGNPIMSGFVDMLNEDYHASPGISKSHLDVIAMKSPRHYWYKYLSGQCEPETPSAATYLGSAMHTSILEMERFEDIYFKLPTFANVANSNAGRAERKKARDENPGRLPLSKDEYEICLRTRDAADANPLVRGLLSNGIAEQSVFALDEETGELIKCQPDYLHRDFEYVVDIKSAKDASEYQFSKDSGNYRYPVQEAWYKFVMWKAFNIDMSIRNFFFIALEKEPPYCMGAYQHVPEDVMLGHEAAMRDYHRIIDAKRTGYFPDFATKIHSLRTPTWARM
ncbi:exodeoxyribonuclease VII [Morganella phage Mecenats66]|nr:exodeoxyribonuclease VII [Morganella phage Mecenats66]